MSDDFSPLSDTEREELRRDWADQPRGRPARLLVERDRLAARVAELEKQQANSPLETLRSAIALYADCRADPEDVAHRIRAALDGFESIAEQAVTEAEAQEKRADENAERISALESAIEENLPEYAYDQHDGTDDEANYIERVEEVGEALATAEKRVAEVERKLGELTRKKVNE
jgi:hypothetical protein